MDPLTWGLIYFYAWNDSPNFFITGTDTAGGTVTPILTPRHTRLHHYGFTADYATSLAGVPFVGDLPFVLRVEGLLSTNVKFADARRQAAALSGGDTNGFVSRDTLTSGDRLGVRPAGEYELYFATFALHDFRLAQEFSEQWVWGSDGGERMEFTARRIP